MAASVAVPPRPGARDPREVFSIFATFSVGPDDAVILARSTMVGELGEIQQHAHQLRRALSLRHGCMVDVQIIDAAGWPEAGGAS